MRAGCVASALIALEGGRLGSWIALHSRVAHVFSEGLMGWWAGAA